MSTSPDQGRYAARGVSSSKSEVHATVDKLDRGLFPGAFCKITEDFLTGSKDKCNVIHADGSGTKSTIAYLHFRETGDASVYRGIAQDSIVMNIDDLLCVGVTGGVLLSSTVNRNARNFPAKALAELIAGTEAVCQTLREYGFSIHTGGGETADVGDLTGTVTVDSCAVAVLERASVISGDDIAPGQVIIGIASDGQANYETRPNSGIGSNGLTSARHDLLCAYYRDKYPETFDPNTPKEFVYCGPYRLEDPLPEGEGMSVGEALLSPTRTYAPLVAALLANPGKRSAIKGIIHCSGGGQTKCLRFGKNVHFIKDKLMPIPPVFRAIEQASGTTWEEMYRVYNMGHRLEIFVEPADATPVLEAARQLGLKAQVIGHTEASTEGDGQNHLTLYHNGTEPICYRH